MARKRFSEREVLETLAWQGIELNCFRCKKPLFFRVIVDGQLYGIKPLRIEREHIHELALGGEDKPLNCRYSHKDCHAEVTNGTSATTAGSSKHRIAKTQGTRAEKFSVNKRPLDEPRPEKRSAFGRGR